MNKELIHSRFAKNISNYNENAKIQKRMAENLIGLCKKNEYKKILEIGCGTGFLTELAVQKLNYESYKAIDIVEECSDYIKQISTDITFIPVDIENYLKESNESFDLIISNASLQWVNDFEGVISALQNRLNKDGELIISTFGPEHFKEIFQITGESLNYYSVEELQRLFPDSYIYPEIYVMSFKTPKDVLNHLKLTGVNAIKDTRWTKKDLIEFERGYKNLCISTPVLTYNPVYFRYILCPTG